MFTEVEREVRLGSFVTILEEELRLVGTTSPLSDVLRPVEFVMVLRVEEAVLDEVALLRPLSEDEEA